MLIGYARISTDDQTLHLQLDALHEVKCERVFKDTASGARTDRPGLTRALEELRTGDTLVVWRLDRLGRSLAHLIQLVEDLKRRGVGFRSLKESIDTTSPSGELVFHMFGALAQFERELIRERTKAGLTAARARGRKGGGRFKLDAKRIALAKELYADPEHHSITDICETLGISRVTLWRYVRGRQSNSDQPIPSDPTGSTAGDAMRRRAYARPVGHARHLQDYAPAPGAAEKE